MLVTMRLVEVSVWPACWLITVDVGLIGSSLGLGFHMPGFTPSFGVTLSFYLRQIRMAINVRP